MKMLKPLDPPKGAQEAMPRAPLPVAGTMRRIGAIFTDYLIFYLVARVLGILAFAPLYPARWALPLVMLVLSTAYFAICSTELTKGRTVGKKLLECRTISREGGYLGIGGALARAALIQLMLLPTVYFRGNIPFRLESIDMLVAVLFLTLIGIAFAVSNLLATIVHPKKLALHDLASGGAVVMAESEQAARQFFGEWSEEERGRLKYALLTPAILGLVIVFFMGKNLMDALPSLRSEGQLAMHEELSGETLRYLGGTLHGPRGRNANPGTPAAGVPTTATLSVFFDVQQPLTEEQLLESDDFQGLQSRLPELPELYLSTADEGTTLPLVAGVKATFIESLWLYFYTENRVVHELEMSLPTAGVSDAATSPTEPILGN